MTKPSPVIGWFESCSPDFDLEFDHADRADLHRYCDDLSRTSDSVHLCLTFDVTVEPSGSEHRSLPLFIWQVVGFRHVLAWWMRNEPDRLSQMWVADVRGKDESHCRVLLRCF